MVGSEQTSCAHEVPRAERIARLNDKLRRTARGGQIFITRGILNLPEFNLSTLLKSLAAYDRFDADNDPHGERDFGDITAFDTGLFWKIDYYDEQLEYGSADPADPNLTTRVLTIMLESEY